MPTSDPSDEMLAALIRRPLSPFEGQEVLRSTVEIPNAGGGLRDALSFEPIEIHHDEEGYLLLHWKCKKVRFDPVKDVDGTLARAHVLEALEATFIDEKFASKHLETQRKRLRKLRDEAMGIASLPGVDDDHEDTVGEED